LTAVRTASQKKHAAETAKDQWEESITHVFCRQQNKYLPENPGLNFNSAFPVRSKPY
jgi:hypothetical protein